MEEMPFDPVWMEHVGSDPRRRNSVGNGSLSKHEAPIYKTEAQRYDWNTFIDWKEGAFWGRVLPSLDMIAKIAPASRSVEEILVHSAFESRVSSSRGWHNALRPTGV